MATGNKQLDDLPPIPDPDGGVLYIVKNDTDYNVPVGGANGIAKLDSAAKIPATLIDKGLANGVAPLNASTKLDGGYIDKGLANGVAPLDAVGKVDRAFLPLIGGDGLVWTVVSTAQAVEPGRGYLVTAAVDITLPATGSAGDEYAVYAKVDNVRLVTNGNTITRVTPGDNILLEAGNSLWLVRSGASEVEIV